MKKFLATTISSLTLLASVLTGSASAAGAGVLSLSGASATVGSNFSVTITENSGTDTVNVAEAILSYDASKIQFVGANCGGAFEIAASVTASGASCATTTPKTGAQTLAVYTFKALSAGSASISLAGSSSMYSSATNTNIWNGAAGTTSYALNAPAAPTVPTNPTNPTNPTVPTTPTTPTNPTTPTTPTNPTTPTTPTTPTAGKTYKVIVSVVDNRDKAVKNASVTLNGKTVKTDNKGKVSFTAIKGGSYTVDAQSGNAKGSTKITVKKDNQTFRVEVKTSKRSIWAMIFGIIGGGLILGGAIYIAFRRQANAQLAVVAAAASKTTKKPATKTSSKAKTTKKTPVRKQVVATAK